MPKPKPPPAPEVNSNALNGAWTLLDEASQLLLRAEAIVLLLGAEAEAEPHQAYAADVAGQLLESMKCKLSQAQRLIRAGRDKSARTR